MRDYAKSSPKFWTHGSGRRLRGDHLAQLVAQYLLSAPLSNMIGLYYISLPTIAHDVGSPLEGASEALARVCKGGFCAFDPWSDLVWVYNVAEIEFGDALKLGDNRIAGIEKLLRTFGQHHFVKGFLHRYGKSFRISLDGMDPAPLEGPWEPLASPLEGASYQDQKQDQKQKQEGPQQKALPPPKFSEPTEEAITKAVTVQRVDATMLALHYGTYCRLLKDIRNRVAPPRPTKKAEWALQAIANAAGGEISAVLEAYIRDPNPYYAEPRISWSLEICERDLGQIYQRVKQPTVSSEAKAKQLAAHERAKQASVEAYEREQGLRS